MGLKKALYGEICHVSIHKVKTFNQIEFTLKVYKQTTHSRASRRCAC